MKIIIESEPKEIAELVKVLQERERSEHRGTPCPKGHSGAIGDLRSVTASFPRDFNVVTSTMGASTTVSGERSEK